MIEEKILAAQGAAEEENRPNPGRPRNSEIDELILSTARSLLAEGGYEAMTFEAIGKQTGIGRPTIYRRWRSKAHLAAAIAYGNHDSPMPVVDGELRAQIAALVEQIAKQYSISEIAAASLGLNSAYYNDEALREELHTPAETNARRQVRAIVAAGKANGTINEAADADILFDLIVGTVIYRTMFSSIPKPEDHTRKLVDHLLRAFAPPPA